MSAPGYRQSEKARREARREALYPSSSGQYHHAQAPTRPAAMRHSQSQSRPHSHPHSHPHPQPHPHPHPHPHSHAPGPDSTRMPPGQSDTTSRHPISDNARDIAAAAIAAMSVSTPSIPDRRPHYGAQDPGVQEPCVQEQDVLHQRNCHSPAKSTSPKFHVPRGPDHTAVVTSERPLAAIPVRSLVRGPVREPVREPVGGPVGGPVRAATPNNISLSLPYGAQQQETPHQTQPNTSALRNAPGNNSFPNLSGIAAAAMATMDLDSPPTASDTPSAAPQQARAQPAAKPQPEQTTSQGLLASRSRKQTMRDRGPQSLSPLAIAATAVGSLPASGCDQRADLKALGSSEPSSLQTSLQTNLRRSSRLQTLHSRPPAPTPINPQPLKSKKAGSGSADAQEEKLPPETPPSQDPKEPTLRLGTPIRDVAPSGSAPADSPQPRPRASPRKRHASRPRGPRAKNPQSRSRQQSLRRGRSRAKSPQLHGSGSASSRLRPRKQVVSRSEDLQSDSSLSDNSQPHSRPQLESSQPSSVQPESPPPENPLPENPPPENPPSEIAPPDSPHASEFEPSTSESGDANSEIPPPRTSHPRDSLPRDSRSSIAPLGGPQTCTSQPNDDQLVGLQAGNSEPNDHRPDTPPSSNPACSKPNDRGPSDPKPDAPELNVLPRESQTASAGPNCSSQESSLPSDLQAGSPRSEGPQPTRPQPPDSQPKNPQQSNSDWASGDSGKAEIPERQIRTAQPSNLQSDATRLRASQPENSVWRSSDGGDVEMLDWQTCATESRDPQSMNPQSVSSHSNGVQPENPRLNHALPIDSRPNTHQPDASHLKYYPSVSSQSPYPQRGDALPHPHPSTRPHPNHPPSNSSPQTDAELNDDTHLDSHTAHRPGRTGTKSARGLVQSRSSSTPARPTKRGRHLGPNDKENFDPNKALVASSREPVKDQSGVCLIGKCLRCYSENFFCTLADATKNDPVCKECFFARADCIFSDNIPPFKSAVHPPPAAYPPKAAVIPDQPPSLVPPPPGLVLPSTGTTLPPPSPSPLCSNQSLSAWSPQTLMSPSPPPTPGPSSSQLAPPGPLGFVSGLRLPQCYPDRQSQQMLPPTSVPMSTQPAPSNPPGPLPSPHTRLNNGPLQAPSGFGQGTPRWGQSPDSASPPFRHLPAPGPSPSGSAYSLPRPYAPRESAPSRGLESSTARSSTPPIQLAPLINIPAPSNPGPGTTVPPHSAAESPAALSPPVSPLTATHPPDPHQDGNPSAPSSGSSATSGSQNPPSGANGARLALPRFELLDVPLGVMTLEPTQSKEQNSGGGT